MHVHVQSIVFQDVYVYSHVLFSLLIAGSYYMVMYLIISSSWPLICLIKKIARDQELFKHSSKILA